MKITCLLLLPLFLLPAAANTLPSEKRKNGPLIQDALAPVQVSLQESSAVFYDNATSTPFIYGTVVSADGFITTKASELDEVESYYVRVGAKKYRAVTVVSRDDNWDVVLVKIEAEGLKAVTFDGPEKLAHGTWVVSNGATERRFRRPRPGIVSANMREIPGGSTAVLGITLQPKDRSMTIGPITEASGAAAAGIKEGDFLLEIDGEKVTDLDAFMAYLGGKAPGDFVKIKVRRGEEEMDFEVEMLARHKIYGGTQTRNDQLSGGETQQSPRRTGFPMILQHETMLDRRTVGGPVFTLDDGFVGMNIAAANRVETFAIPAAELAKIVKNLRAQKSE